MKVPKEMLPRFVPVGDGRTFVPLEDLIAKNLDALFPGHGDRRPRGLPGHARRRLHGLRRGRRPRARGRGRAAPAPLRRGGPGRGRRLDERRDARADHRPRSPPRRRTSSRCPGLLDLEDLWDIVGVPGHADLRDKPWTPVTQPRLQPDEDEEPDVMAAMRKGDILLHHPYDSFSTLGRAVRRAGRRRPGRARDQADRVPHQRRLAARPGADPRRRARQAGGLRGGGQGALRRAGQHPVGALARAGRRARRARPAGAQDARQVPADRAPRGRRRAPLRARRDGQLPPEDRAPVHGLRPAHLRRGDRRRRRRHVQLPHRLRPPARTTGRCSSRPRTCATRSSARSRRTIAAHEEGRARPHPDEDELAGGPALHPGALPRLAGRGAGRAQRARDLLPAPGRARRVGEHPRHVGRRALPRALAHLRLRARRRVHASTSARPT